MATLLYSSTVIILSSLPIECDKLVSATQTLPLKAGTRDYCFLMCNDTWEFPHTVHLRKKENRFPVPFSHMLKFPWTRHQQLSNVIQKTLIPW